MCGDENVKQKRFFEEKSNRKQILELLVIFIIRFVDFLDKTLERFEKISFRNQDLKRYIAHLRIMQKNQG
jgi:hypothetical protein